MPTPIMDAPPPGPPLGDRLAAARARVGDSAFGRVFRHELRRLWTPARLARAVLFVVAVLGVQALCTLAVIASVPPGRGPATGSAMIQVIRSPVYGWLGTIGLMSSPVLSLRLSAGTGSGGWLPFGLLAVLGIVAQVGGVANRFVMPVYAGACIAELRKHQRAGQLARQGLSPAQILVAVGGAAMAPFLVLSALSLGIQILEALVSLGGFAGRSASSAPVFLWRLVTAPVSVVNAVLIGALCVCVSAHFQRPFRAATAAYLVTWTAMALYSFAAVAIFASLVPVSPSLARSAATSFITLLLPFLLAGVTYLVARSACRILAVDIARDPGADRG